MMPLARWLEGRERQAVISSEPQPDRPQDVDEIPSGVTDAASPSAAAERVRELEMALAAANAGIEREREQADARERDIRQQLGADLHAGVMQELRHCLETMQESLELALADVLTPFLSRAVAAKAHFDLMDLVGQLLRSDDQLIEVRAPAEFHGMLRDAMGAAGIAVTPTEDASVSFAFSNRREAFEILSERWILCIEGLAHEQ